MEGLRGQVLDFIYHEIVHRHALEGVTVPETLLQVVYDVHEVVGVLLGLPTLVFEEQKVYQSSLVEV